MWFIQNLSATETTDNLLDNNSFTTDTSDWELSDSNQEKVKRDPLTYNNSASKSIRFRYQDGNISQDVDISEVLDNHLVKEINMNFQSIGCGNTGSEWCYGGADDTIVNVITLSSTDTTEIITNTTEAPYEDGWSTYSFTEEVTGTFNTDDLNINLTITGNDTGNSSNWYGPIIDNINLTLTIEEYIAPIVEEVVVETMIGGLDLSTEVTLDLIQDIQVMPELEMIDMPELENIEISIAPIETIDMPEIELPNVVDIQPITEIEMPVDLPETVEVEPIQEIQEIEIEEPVELETEVVEVAEELSESTMEEDLAEATVEEDVAETEEPNNEDIQENENEQEEEIAEASEQESKETDGKNDNSKLSKSSNTNKKQIGKKSTTKNKKTKKTKSKENKKDKIKKITTNKITKNKTMGKNSISKDNHQITNIQDLVTIILPEAYLQVLRDSITITETISLKQEMIYEQDITDFTSHVAWDNLNRSTEHRWNNLLGVKPRHSFRGYRK